MGAERAFRPLAALHVLCLRSSSTLTPFITSTVLMARPRGIGVEKERVFHGALYMDHPLEISSAPQRARP